MISILKKIDSGIFLMSIGVIFLLNVTGFVGWDIWLFYLNLWPFFLILAGIRIILSINKKLEPISIVAGTVLSLLIIFSGLVYYKVNGGFLNLKGEVQNYQSRLALNSTDNNNYSYDFNLSFGDYVINNNTDNSNYVLNVNGNHSSNISDPEISVTNSNTGLKNIVFNQIQSIWFMFPFFNNTSTYNIQIGVNNIQDYRIKLGAGKVTSTLNNVNIKSSNVDVGAGEVTLNLENYSSVSNITANVGAGKIVLNIPKNMGYVITYSVGAGSVRINGTQSGGLGSHVSNQKSDNYNSATKLVNISVSVGAGEFVLNNVSE